MHFFRCSCFATDNIHLRAYDLHVRYRGREQFWSDYGKVLTNCGCDTEEKKRATYELIEAEICRRKEEDGNVKSRRDMIQTKYVRKHPEVYTLSEDYFEPAFMQCVKAAKESPDKVLQHVTVVSPMKKLYSFPVFKAEFCKKLIDELENFQQSDMPKERPNTMNRYGVLLGDLGFDEHFLNPLRENYLTPISKALFPEWTGSKFDSHKAFTVQYQPEKDDDLGCHYDNSEVTLNVCLGKTFLGGEAYFSEMRTVDITLATCVLLEQYPGVGILHRGQERHGALSIFEGTRINMVTWLRSSEIRNALCPMCDRAPQLVPSYAFGDGFTK
ncbi:2-oxoglutarate and iron-dependent oxygenase domain-containing protein 2-like [Ornithodoros turicata]|uniref:2-oxoglutarate and iron-dependent oxygenase domain-containing protein 2-like n=1 Tax=Ornithodoros turicata TaxID=34597 RepID=UPI00313A3075